MTEDFRPGNEELNLYREVSSYLQQDDLLAIKPGARHLVTLVIRKILASSAYAIQGTLATMIDRLEKKLPLTDALQDYESIDDLADENNVEEGELCDPKALQAEIDKLKDYKQLATNITQNAKADALLRVLDKAFDFAVRLGGTRKAVIFTESVRTQTWLFKFLGQHGYLDQLVLLNGSNNDADSKQIYKAWLKKHQGSSRVSGSKSSDMKAALVDKFREDATIMICTEAGAEGINLQFCSLIINYDLPWNPQRVEQRIGRVHRYGQKHDVVVVNFINKGNRADERVFELLSQKFKLFEGVFGASDEILGSIESGVDIERRIHDIYQKCRNDDQIEEEFNLLQAELQTDLEARSQDTRRSLLENFDVDVVKQLNLRREATEQHLNDYQQRFLQLARMQLPGALPEPQAVRYTEQYRALLQQAEVECPPPDPQRKPGQRGRVKLGKARNLLERLLNYEQETLRFMTDARVPFTNNQGENDIRMTKVHQKISGCFRSQEGADIFCRVRSYLSTCRKNNVSASKALALLFDGKLPDFIL